MSKCALIDIDSVAPDWNSNSESSAESVQELQEEAATEHYVKVGKSKLRNDLELQIDPKYAGEKISRNDMDIQFQSEEEEFEFGSSDEEFEIVSNADSFEKQDEKIDDDQSQIPYKSDDCHSNISEEDLMAKLETQEFEERQQISKISENAKEDAEKGVHVRSQMTLWDNFLDFRINTQKILDSANAMPIAKDYDRIISDSAARSAVDCATNELWKLFDILVDIRKELILPDQITCEYKMLKRKRHGNQLEMINSAWEDILNPMERGFEKFRNETIEKWNNKIQLSSAAISQKKFKVINQSIISQISASMAHPEKLLKRTKLNRAGIKIIGKAPKIKNEQDKSENEDYEEEIFDDGDYYQQLLKELIDSRMTDTSDPVLLSIRHAQLKQLQKRKSKKNIDTRASKGRKIRYQVQEKIQNFMAPEPRGTWHEEMKEELFSSLLGRKLVKSDSLLIKDGFKLF